MSKKILLALTLVSFSLSLAACGSPKPVPQGTLEPTMPYLEGEIKNNPDFSKPFNVVPETKADISDCLGTLQNMDPQMKDILEAMAAGYSKKQLVDYYHLTDAQYLRYAEALSDPIEIFEENHREVTAE